MLGKRIDVNSLRNKKSDGKQIIYFEYTIDKDLTQTLNEDQTFRFYKINEVNWRVELVTQPNEQMPYRLFSEVFQLPNASVPLSVICGVGMASIKEVIMIEMQYYSSLQFTIAEEVNKIANQSSNMR